MQRESASVSLAKMRGTTAHILHVADRSCSSAFSRQSCKLRPVDIDAPRFSEMLQMTDQRTALEAAIVRRNWLQSFGSSAQVRTFQQNRTRAHAL